MIRNAVLKLTNASRQLKRFVVLTYDTLITLVALGLAFITRYSSFYIPARPVLIPIIVACTALAIGTLYAVGVYHTVTRYLDLREIKRFAIAGIVLGLSWIIALYMVSLPVVPRSIGLIWPAYATLLWFAGRYVFASLAVDRAEDGALMGKSGRPVLIYGANATGIALVEDMRRTQSYRALCFIDDNPAFWGQRIAGLRVYPPGSIAKLIEDNGITDACLAFRSRSGTARAAALKLLTEHNLNVKTVPGPEELLNGRVTVSHIRPVNVTDLLSRDAVRPQRKLIESAVTGQAILVTGAGGSIGSEICRQVFRERPTRLILLDHSELALYTISQELLAEANGMPDSDRPELVSVIGSILDMALLRETVRDHAVDAVFHAAAYKHVPLLEHNEVVGVENNVIGTHNLVEIAREFDLRRFIMISTDKAVRPANVLGATKRVAELIIQAAAITPGCRTKYGIVRFGNVLDSSGSVVQLFRRQIGDNHPVTVTHRDVTRFFMSIPEATQLVLQASAMADRGEVFVLDMGEPVRIYDLAKNMIRLSGCTIRDEQNPDGDIPIEIVGLRPGEKLYEELFVGDHTEDTQHPRIQKAMERHLSPEELRVAIARLARLVAERDVAALRATLMNLVAEDRVGGTVAA